MEQALSNQDKAGGEMLNPATSNVSVESIPPEHEKKPEFSALGSAYKQQEAFAETDKWAQGQAEREEAGDAWQNSWSHIGGRIVSGSSDEGGRIVRADDLERENADSILGINQAAYDVNDWMLDRGNEKKAERAAFHFYRTINPDATPDEIAQVWQQGVFGESTKNNASLFASALEQIVGSSRQVLDIARKVERGEMRPEEGMAYLEGKTVDGDKKNAFDVATALNQSAIGNSRELRTFRYLRNVQGLSIQETMMARAISRTARTHSGAIDKTPDMVVAQAKRWGVPSERIPVVVNAAVSVMPEDDAGIFAQTWDNYVSMTNRSFYSAKGAFDRVRIGSIQNSVAESREAKDSLVYNGPDFDMGVISQVVSEAKKQGLGVTHTARGNFVNFKTPQDKERFLSMLESAVGVKEEEARIHSVLRQNLAFNYSNPSATARVLGGVGYTVTLAAPILATGGAPAAGIVGSAALGGGVEGLNVADAAFAEGASVERSNVAGLGAAAVSGTLELVGGKILSEAVHGVKLLSGLTRGTGSSASVSALSNSDLATLFAGKEGVKRLLAKGGKLVGTELATESAQTISGEGFRQWAVDGDAWEGIKSGGKEIVDPEFIATVLLSSVLMGGAGKASAALENRRAQDRAYKYLAQNPKAVQFLRDIGALDKDVKIDMEGAASRNDVEAAANAYFRTIVSEKATDQALAAIDKATDQAALNSQGGLTLDNTAFVNAVMSPMPEDSTVYKAEWDVDRKKEFIAGRTGIKKRQVSSDLLRAFDVLSNAVEITAAKLRHASTYAAESRKATDGITLDDVTTAELEGDSTSSAISEDLFNEVLRRFIDSDVDMGDADIRSELEAYISGEGSVTPAIKTALDGMRQRAQSPYQVAAALDAFGRSCAPDLRSRTTNETRDGRFEFFALNNVGLLQNEVSAYERYQRSRYLSEVSERHRYALHSLSVEGRKRFTQTLSEAFGVPVETGPVPAWATPAQRAEIHDGKIQGIYLPDRVWISEDAVVGTGLHEAVWHATWRWAKANSPEIYRQLQEYARNVPRWIHEEIAREYDTADVDLVLEEVGAFVFENEFEGDFQNFLNNSESKAWFEGFKKAFNKAFSRMAKKGAAKSPHDAVRALYKNLESGARYRSGVGQTQVELPSSSFSEAEAQAMEHYDPPRIDRSGVREEQQDWNDLQDNETAIADWYAEELKIWEEQESEIEDVAAETAETAQESEQREAEISRLEELLRLKQSHYLVNERIWKRVREYGSGVRIGNPDEIEAELQRVEKDLVSAETQVMLKSAFVNVGKFDWARYERYRQAFSKRNALLEKRVKLRNQLLFAKARDARNRLRGEISGLWEQIQILKSASMVMPANVQSARVQRPADSDKPKATPPTDEQVAEILNQIETPGGEFSEAEVLDYEQFREIATVETIEEREILEAEQALAESYGKLLEGINTPAPVEEPTTGQTARQYALSQRIPRLRRYIEERKALFEANERLWAQAQDLGFNLQPGDSAKILKAREKLLKEFEQASVPVMIKGTYVNLKKFNKEQFAKFRAAIEKRNAIKVRLDRLDAQYKIALAYEQRIPLERQIADLTRELNDMEYELSWGTTPPDVRYSRKRPHSWDTEVDVSKYAIISAVHTLAAGLPAKAVRLAKLPASLDRYDRASVVARADALCEFVRARYGNKEFTLEEALNAVKEARRDVESRLIYAPVYEEMNVGTETEIQARTTVSEEVDRIKMGRKGYSPRVVISITNEMTELAEALKRSAGMVKAEQQSEHKLEEDAASFGALIEEIAAYMPRTAYNPEEGVDRAAVVRFVIDMARDGGFPDAQIEMLEALATELDSEHLDVHARANAFGILSEVWEKLVLIEDMREKGTSIVKDKAAEARRQKSEAEAEALLRQLEDSYEGMSFDELVKRTAGSVLVAAYNKVCETFDVDSRISLAEGKEVDVGQEVRLVLSKYSEVVDKLSEQLAAARETVKQGALLNEERAALNETVKDLEFRLNSFMVAFEHGGAFIQAFKNGIEQVALKQLDAGASGAVVTRLAEFRSTQSISEALAQAYSLLAATATKGSTWRRPFLFARLQSFIKKMSKIDETVNDDASYYTPEYRVFMGALRSVWDEHKDSSFQQVADAIAALTSPDVIQDDHSRAKARALEFIGGASFMSSEMLDMAFWRILAEQDASFVAQRAKIRQLRKDVTAMAVPFIKALQGNPHYHDYSNPKGAFSPFDSKELSKMWRSSSQMFFSIEDRLRGMVKRASGEEYESARKWAGDFNRELNKSAAAFDSLMSSQEEWSTAMLKRILGKNWTNRLFELNNRVVDDSDLKDSWRFDHSSNPDVRLSGFTPMQLLHVYMSSKQKSFQAAIMTPNAFSEVDFSKLEARQNYVADSREGGELDTFIKTYQGGILYQMAEAWRARWAEIFPQLNEAYRTVYGFDMYDPFGETNYYPLTRYDKASAPAVQGGVILPVARRFQSRTINVNDLDVSASFLSVVNEQMESVLHTIAFAPVHLEIERLWQSHDFAKALHTRVKTADRQALEKHIWDTLATPAQKPSSELEYLTSLAVGATAFIALAGNIKAGLQQVFGGATYIAKHEGRLWDGIKAATYILHSPKQWYEDAKRLFSEPEVKARWNEYDRALNLAAAKGSISNGQKFLRKLKNYSLWMINRGDMVPAITAGVGFYRLAYSEALREGKTHEVAHREAMHEFIYLTETSQQTRRESNMWALQRHSLGKAFTQFTTMNDQALGNNLRAWADLFGAGMTGLKSGARWKRWAKSVLAHGLLFAAFTEFMMDLVSRVLFEELDDDEEFWDLDWKGYAAAAAQGGAYRSTPYRLFGSTVADDWKAGDSWFEEVPVVSVPASFYRKGKKAVVDSYYFAIDENPKKPGYPSKKTVEDIFRQWMKISPAGKQILDFCDKQFGEDESEMNYPH